MNDDTSALVASALLEQSRHFAATVCDFPTANNRLERLLTAGRTTHAEIAAHARSVCIGVHRRVVPILRAFLHWKANDDAIPPSARALFASLSVDEFALRLVKQRPLAFLTSFDHAKLRGTSGGSALDRNAFTHIGTATESNNLRLADYISYHEIILAALITVSSYTLFINNGDRGNCARLSSAPFVPCGVYIGAVGARFERDDQMETLFIIVNRDRSVEANGYGRGGVSAPLLAVFAPLYGVSHFPSWSEAVTEYEARTSDAECRYSRLGGGELFDRLAFRARIRVTLETVLLDADRRGADSGRSAFVYLVGLGLGVWAVTKREQCALFLDELALAIAQLSLAHVGDVYVSWFPPETQRCGTARDGDSLRDARGHAVTIRFGNASPADPMPNAESLLVATFAWDGNSFPGNEYWLGSLAASGDPAAACCSTIPEIQNAWINPNFDSSHVIVLGRANDRWVLRHHSNSSSKPSPLLGWLFLDTMRHVGGPAEFDDNEAIEFGQMLKRASSLVKQLTGCDRVYVIIFGEAHAHVHAHLVPRVHGVDDTKAWNVADLYRAVAALERPQPVAVDDVGKFVEQARKLWNQNQI